MGLAKTQHTTIRISVTRRMFIIIYIIILVGISQQSYIHKSQSNREEQYSQDNNDNCSCHIDHY